MTDHQDLPRNDANRFVRIARPLDLTCIAAAHYLASRAREGMSSWDRVSGSDTLLAMLLFCVIADYTGLYLASPSAAARTTNGISSAWLTWGITVTLTVAAGVATGANESYSRIVLLLWFMVTPLLLSAARVATASVARIARSRPSRSS